MTDVTVCFIIVFYLFMTKTLVNVEFPWLPKESEGELQLCLILMKACRLFRSKRLACRELCWGQSYSTFHCCMMEKGVVRREVWKFKYHIISWCDFYHYWKIWGIWLLLEKLEGICREQNRIFLTWWKERGFKEKRWITTPCISAPLL